MSHRDSDYSDYTPTITWSGGTPTAPTINEASYQVINRTVTFKIDISGNNDCGSTLTAVAFTAPETVTDVNAYIPCFSAYAKGSSSTPTTVALGLVVANVNLNITVRGFTIDD